MRNISFGGAKVESALSNALRIDQDDALVILEIGGNDLLGGTTIPKFREDLEKMLTLVCAPHRRVVMIELPLPPFYNRYGMVQRALCKATEMLSTSGVTDEAGASTNGKGRFFSGYQKRNRNSLRRPTNAPPHVAQGLRRRREGLDSIPPPRCCVRVL